MKKEFIPAEGVSNIELFYDLIFVYCISVLTSMCHHFEGSFPDLGTWIIYLFSFLVVLQVWFFTTHLMNRYGDRSAPDNICLFINMFLLYFLASGIQTDWYDTAFTFNIAWALILVNLLVHWCIKRWRYTNLDEDDKSIMNTAIIVLAIQLAIVLVAAFIPGDISALVSWVALLFGLLVFVRARSYRRKPAHFTHLAERCSLLVIVAFGEMIVAIASYMTETSSMLYPILVFALIVGLFLIYIFEHDNMIDHHKQTDGMLYMSITGWLILVIGNLAVALEFMTMPEVAVLPKSIYLAVFLVLYLLTSFLLGIFNKPEFHYSTRYAIGRIGACLFIVIVALATNFNPMVNLVCDTIAVYFALWYEWMLYHKRTRLMMFGHCLGYTDEVMVREGYTFTTREGRRKIEEAAKEAWEENGGSTPCK